MKNIFLVLAILGAIAPYGLILHFFSIKGSLLVAPWLRCLPMVPLVL